MASLASTKEMPQRVVSVMDKAEQALVVAVSGSSGLVGTVLCDRLSRDGHSLRRIVRRPPLPGSGDIYWDVASGSIDHAALAGVDAVIHLAGESIGGGRWTSERKELIRRSRVEGTKLLCGALARLEPRPRSLLCASAVGYYGDRGEELLTEASSKGSGFLSDVADEWEKACAAASEAGIRVCNMRFGMILDKDEGALAQMLTPFSLGLGGYFGSGKQYMSWIHLDDLVEAIKFALHNENLEGAVNFCSPQPVQNRDFAAALGRALGRPAALPVPGFAIRLLLGEMGEALVLEGARVIPERLLDSGFTFRHPQIDEALQHVLQKSR